MQTDQSRRVGITTTVPVEVLYAAGRVPVDLNNVFAADPDARRLVQFAERRAFPPTACAWTKGIYGAVHECGIREVVAVTEGDCSSAIGLAEILESEGVTVHPFSYPLSRRPEDLAREIARFAERMGTTVPAAETEKMRLDDVRRKAAAIDELAAEGRVKSGDLFSALLSTTDFLGDPETCAKQLDETLARIRADDSPPPPIRLSWVGVPAVWPDAWERVEALGARVVDHEVPRQFALPGSVGRDLVATYLAFTYPYDTASRIRDAAREAERRGASGVVHYVQSFCHRAIGDRLWREGLRLPVLTLEADRPGLMDERTRTRFEAFLERLSPPAAI